MEGALYCRPCGEDVVEAVATEVQSVNMPKVDVVQSDHENEREFDLRDNSDDKYESESDDEMLSLAPHYVSFGMTSNALVPSSNAWNTRT